jgi:hypothetical protein
MKTRGVFGSQFWCLESANIMVPASEEPLVVIHGRWHHKARKKERERVGERERSYMVRRGTRLRGASFTLL